MIGCGGVVVRLKHDVDWRAWAAKYVPQAVEKSDKGLVYLETAVPILGPAPVQMAARDARTVVISGGLDHLHALVAATKCEAPNGILAGWPALEGGLAAAVFSNGSIDRSAKMPKAPQCEVVLAHAKAFGVALDFDAANSRLHARLDLTCADEAAARKVQDALEALAPKIGGELRDGIATIPHVSGGQDPALQTALFWKDMAESATTEAMPLADGSVAVRLASSAPFPEFIVRAEKVAEATAAPPVKR
jgi:hypothetical protein